MTDYDEPPPPPHPADGLQRVGAPDRPTPIPMQQATPVAAMASQSTAIEATRAVAEVQALVGAARMFPRNPDKAVARMHEACGRPEVVADAFYSYRRAGNQVHGPTVQLMRILAACWGNVTHGTRELYRDEANGQSEVQAWAWDLETNHRVERNFMVPHRRDKDGGRVPLTSDRDVYEMNTNQASRREREMIAQVLPAWFVARAVELCEAGIQGDPTVPLAMRVAKVVAFFGDTYGVKPDQLETYVDAPRNDWTVFDLARLQAVGSSLHRGETTVDAEFPRARLTAAEVAAQHTAPPAAGTPAYADDDPERPM